MPKLHSHTHCQAAQAQAQTKACKRVCFSLSQKDIHIFSSLPSVLYFFATHNRHENTAKATSDKDRHNSTDRTPAGNSVLPQLAVTPIKNRGKLCRIEAECSYQTFVQFDTEVLPCLPAGREIATMPSRKP